MRLTLRTLLSWKDGMLAEDAARDLAGKVEASDAARRLVERIDEVTTRPTLSAPAPDATGFATAANSTAEYLDNVLSDEQLGAFERICFASDAQLAETAACHEILAGWSREQSGALDAATRRRLLAAVQARAATREEGADDGAPPAVIPGLHPKRAAGRSAARSKRNARPATAAWLLVAAALLLLSTLVGVLGWSLTKRGVKPPRPEAVALRPAAEDRGKVEETPPRVAASDGAEEVVPPPVAAPVPPIAAAPVAAEPTPPPTPPAPVAVAREEEFPPRVDELEPPGFEPMDAGTVSAPVVVAIPAAATPPAGPPVDQRVPQGDALAIAAPAVPVAEAVRPPADPSAPPARPADQAAAGAATVAGPAMLLHRPAGNAVEPWRAGATGAPLAPPADLLAPPFGRPAVVIDGVRIAFEPGTRAVLARDADGTPRVEVVFGAAAVVGGKFGATAGGLAGVVTTGVAAPVGVEVRLLRRPGDGPEATQRIARVIPSGGPIGWRTTAADGSAPAQPLAGIGAAADIPVGRALEWRSEAPDAATVAASGPTPPWLAGRVADDPIDRRAAEAVTTSLATAPAAVPALAELAAGRRAEDRVAAAATLALTGEFDEAARLLAADGAVRLTDGLWSRLEIAAVEPALARGPRAAEALARAFAAHAPPGAADAIVRFARGFTDEELAAGAAAELVAALESPHLVVRRYAIKNLVEITQADAVDRLRYRADRGAEASRDGVAWWRARLDQGRIRRGAAP